jgi:hypothetical protein
MRPRSYCAVNCAQGFVAFPMSIVTILSVDFFICVCSAGSINIGEPVNLAHSWLLQQKIKNAKQVAEFAY